MADEQINPYEAPAGPAKRDWLSRRERKILEFYLRYRETAPTLWAVFRPHLVRWIVIFLVLTGMALQLLINWGRNSRWFELEIAAACGCVFTAFPHDIATVLQFLRFWPLHREILDWQAIERIRDERG